MNLIQVEYLHNLLREDEILTGEEALGRLIMILIAMRWAVTGKTPNSEQISRATGFFCKEYGEINTETVNALWDRIPALIKNLYVQPEIFERKS